MLTVLQGAAGPMSAASFQAAVQKQGGDLSYLQLAAKMLRDRGILVATNRAGGATTWYLASSAPEADRYVEQETKNMFSEAISMARSTAYAKGAGSRASRSKAITNAVVLGERLGYAPDEVIDMCKPLPPRAAASTP
jgi:hypothetical protein